MTVFNEWFPGSIFGTSHVNVKAFGALGNGSHNTMTELGFFNVSAANTGTGGNGIAYPKATQMSDTADWCGIQAAVDYALQNEIMNVVMPDGEYYINDTIHLGYGMLSGVANFNTIVLSGAGWSGVAGLRPGTVLFALFKNRPIINIQGGRQSGVQGINIAGTTAITWPGDENLSGRANAANYVPSGAQDNQFAPFCGVCIDGYAAGSVYTSESVENPPASPYPTPRFPSWVQSTTKAYNKGFTSEFFVKHCNFYNTLIGIMVQPYIEGNGDFARLNDNSFYELKIGICLGNSQARSTDFQNCIFTFVHTAFQGSGYGHGIANMGGNWSNIICNKVYRMLHHDAAQWSAPLFINGLYVEQGMCLGDFAGSYVAFEDCALDLGDHIGTATTKTISGISFSGGLATVTVAAGSELATWGAFGWRSGKYLLSIQGSTNAAYNTGWINGEWVSNTTFTYPIAGTPGSYSGGAHVDIVPISQWRAEPVFYGAAIFRNVKFNYRMLYHFAGGRVSFEKVSFGTPTAVATNYTSTPEGFQKAANACGHVIIDMDVSARFGHAPFRDVNSSYGRCGEAATGLDLITFDEYNSWKSGHTLWGTGQKDTTHSLDYDISRPFARYDQVSAAGDGSPLTDVTWTIISVTGAGIDLVPKIEVGDIFNPIDRAYFYVHTVSGGTITLKALTWFKLAGGVLSMFTAADIDYGKGSEGPGDDYDPSAWAQPIYIPIGTLDLVPASSNGLGGTTGIFMRTAAASPTIEFVNAAGTAVTTPAALTLKSKPLWVGISPVYTANTLPFPANTAIALIGANTLTMSADALTAGTWAYGPGIKRLK